MATNMLMPAATVIGAPRVPVPFGIFSVLAPRADDTTRWQGGGVTWEFLDGSVQPGVLGGVQGNQPAVNGTVPDYVQASGLPKDLDAHDQGYGNAQPFTVYGHSSGSILARTFDERNALAVQHLQTFEERQVEAALWDGISDPNLTENTTAVGSSAYAKDDLISAIADLEDFLADTYGSQGLIHLSRKTATLAMKYGALQPNRNQLTTRLNTPVIAGTGYEDGLVIATPPLFGYRSDIFTSSGRSGDLTALHTNDVTAIAERTYLIGFDPTGVGVATITE